MTNTTKELPAVSLLLDSCRGTHIPQAFVNGFDLSLWGLDESYWAVQTCKQGHDAEFYWDAWDEILNKAKMTTGHTLYQNGDLWAINVDKMSSEELENFEFDEELIEERKCSELIKELKEHPGVTHNEYLSPGQHDVYVLDDTTSGDYCGGYVQLANFQYLDEKFNFLQQRHEGYGSSMLCFQDEDLHGVPSEELKELIELLDSLQDYPVLNDELLSRLEFEASSEAYEDWGRKDFQSELVSNSADTFEDLYENATDEQLDTWFRAAQEATGEDWRQDGEGLTIYIDVRRLAKWHLERYAHSAC